MDTRRSKRKRTKESATDHQPLDNAQWEELRDLMLQEARSHDHDTAFTPENINLHRGLEFLLHIYQCGRERRLPPEWLNAWNYMEQRKTPEWREYQYVKHRMEALQQQFHDVEWMNLTDVIGAPFSAVLENELKADVGTGRVTSPNGRSAQGADRPKKKKK